MELNLTDSDIQGLAAGDVAIMEFADALRSRQDNAGAVYGTVMDAATPLAQIVSAIADSAPSATAAILSRIAANVNSGTQITPAEHSRSRTQA